jgi:hypothetical protein
MNQASMTTRRDLGLARAGRGVVADRTQPRALSKRVAVNVVSTIANLATSPGASTSG